MTATLDDPHARPLLEDLQAEYLNFYGESVAADLDAYDAGEFLPPTGALLLAVAGEETVAGGALRRWAAGVGADVDGPRPPPAGTRGAADPRCLCFEKRLAMG